APRRRCVDIAHAVDVGVGRSRLPGALLRHALGRAGAQSIETLPRGDGGAQADVAVFADAARLGKQAVFSVGPAPRRGSRGSDGFPAAERVRFFGLGVEGELSPVPGDPFTPCWARAFRARRRNVARATGTRPTFWHAAQALREAAPRGPAARRAAPALPRETSAGAAVQSRPRVAAFSTQAGAGADVGASLRGTRAVAVDHDAPELERWVAE